MAKEEYLEGRRLVTMLLLNPPRGEAICSFLNCQQREELKVGAPFVILGLRPKLNSEIGSPGDSKIHAAK